MLLLLLLLLLRLVLLLLLLCASLPGDGDGGRTGGPRSRRRGGGCGRCIGCRCRCNCGNGERVHQDAPVDSKVMHRQPGHLGGADGLARGDGAKGAAARAELVVGAGGRVRVRGMRAGVTGRAVAVVVAVGAR